MSSEHLARYDRIMRIKNLLGMREDMSDDDLHVFDDVVDDVWFIDGFSPEDEEFEPALRERLEAEGFPFGYYLDPEPQVREATWEYALADTGNGYGVYELYTDADGKTSWTASSVSPIGDDPDDLRAVLALMAGANKVLDLRTGEVTVLPSVTLTVYRGERRLMVPSTGNPAVIRAYATGVADILSSIHGGLTGGFDWDGQVPFELEVAGFTLELS